MGLLLVLGILAMGYACWACLKAGSDDDDRNGRG